MTFEQTTDALLQYYATNPPPNVGAWFVNAFFIMPLFIL